MSSNYYRDRAQRLLADIAQLETKEAGERERAARERASALRTTGSISRTTSQSMVDSKQREARRSDEKAVDHDRRAADYGKQIASKRTQLAQAQRDADRADVAERQRASAGPGGAGVRIRRHAVVRAVEVEPIRALHGEVMEGEGFGKVDIARLADETTLDAVLDVSKGAVFAMVAAVPVIGPVVREVIGAAWTDTRVDRIERFVVELGRNVEAVQGRMDRDFVKRAEFHAAVEEVVERVVLRRNETKIPRFAAALTHSATTERPATRMRERFMDWLDQLRPIHVEILDRLVNEPEGWVRSPEALTIGQVAYSRLEHALDGLDTDRYDLRELESRGLIESLDDSSVLLPAANQLSRLVTPMGRQFHAFITAQRRDLANLREDPQ